MSALMSSSLSKLRRSGRRSNRPASLVEEEEVMSDAASVQDQQPLEYHANIRPHEDPRTSERKRKATNTFVAGSSNSMMGKKKRKIPVMAVESRRRKGSKSASKLGKSHESSSTYYRSTSRTPQTLMVTIRDLTPPSVLVTNPATIHSNDDDNNSNNYSRSDWSSQDKPSIGKKRSKKSTTTCQEKKLTSKPAAAEKEDDLKGENEDNKSTMEVTTTATTAATAKKKKKRTKQSKAIYHRQTTRCWRFIPCQECISCLRTSDCGKCAQCLRYMECILRQCITPVRDDRLIPKTVHSDDESLKSMQSNVSDLDWNVAFPEETYGALTPEQVWSYFQKDPDSSSLKE